MEEERDFVVFTDDDGNDIELDVIDYFDYNGNEYAVLIDSAENAEHGDECECGCDGETSMYIFRVIVNEEEDTEEFVAPAEEDMDALIEIVQARFEGACDDDCDCDCEDGCGDTCDCGCHGDK